MRDSVVLMRGSRLGVVLVVAFALSATALASSGYRLYSSADQHPVKGSVFTASAHGFAPKKSLLYLYLDRKPCRSTQALEAKRVNAKTYKAGQSYFRQSGPKRAFISLSEAGQFYKSFTAYAGTTAERENVCAYLLGRNSRGLYRVNAAVASSHYTVTS
jgi:hypothetical protein